MYMVDLAVRDSRGKYGEKGILGFVVLLERLPTLRVALESFNRSWKTRPMTGHSSVSNKDFCNKYKYWTLIVFCRQGYSLFFDITRSLNKAN